MSYLSATRSVEAVTPHRDNSDALKGDYYFPLCLNRESFEAILDIPTFQNQHLIVVERKQPHHIFSKRTVATAKNGETKRDKTKPANKSISNLLSAHFDRCVQQMACLGSYPPLHYPGCDHVAEEK